MAQLWSVLNNTSLANLVERQTIEIPLPVIDPATTVQVISGSLPAGMLISGQRIVGTPLEVVRTTNYNFVIRASLNGEIDDRTFTITVFGADDP